MKRNKAIIPVKEYLKSLKRVKNPPGERTKFLRLDKNENTLGFSPGFMKIVRREITSDFVNTYPEIEPLYEKIARWAGCRKENIYITAGSDAAIKAAFEIFVEPGDKVALLSPTYAMFHVYSGMSRAHLIEIRYQEGLSLATEDILRVIREDRPKLICLANPNSPTGTILPPEDLRQVIDAAAKKGTVVLVDEAYYLFYPETVIDLINDCPNLIVTRTFSKAFGLASARLGFAAGHADTINYLHKVRPMYETNAFAVKLAELILDNFHLVEKNLEELRKGKQYLGKELDQSGIPYFKSYANFILIDVGSFKKSVEIGQALYQEKILIKSGFKDDILRNCIRVTIGNVKQMKVFMEKFKQVF